MNISKIFHKLTRHLFRENFFHFFCHIEKIFNLSYHFRIFIIRSNDLTNLRFLFIALILNEQVQHYKFIVGTATFSFMKTGLLNPTLFLVPFLGFTVKAA